MKAFKLFCLGLLFPLFSIANANGNISSECLGLNGEKPQVACSITGVEIIERYCEGGRIYFYFQILGTDFGINSYTMTNNINNEVLNFDYLFYEFIQSCSRFEKFRSGHFY